MENLVLKKRLSSFRTPWSLSHPTFEMREEESRPCREVAYRLKRLCLPWIERKVHLSETVSDREQRRREKAHYAVRSPSWAGIPISVEKESGFPSFSNSSQLNEQGLDLILSISPPLIFLILPFWLTCLADDFFLSCPQNGGCKGKTPTTGFFERQIRVKSIGLHLGSFHKPFMRRDDGAICPTSQRMRHLNPRQTSSYATDLSTRRERRMEERTKPPSRLMKWLSCKREWKRDRFPDWLPV